MPAINESKLDLYSSLDGLDLLKGAFAPGLEPLAAHGALLRGIAADDVDLELMCRGKLPLYFGWLNINV